MIKDGAEEERNAERQSESLKSGAKWITSII